MDARIAIITGTVFAGVLVAGALAAPRGDGNASGEDDSAVVTTAAQAPAPVVGVLQAETVSQTAKSVRYEDDGDARDDDRDDGHGDVRKKGRDHEEDDD